MPPSALPHASEDGDAGLDEIESEQNVRATPQRCSQLLGTSFSLNTTKVTLRECPEPKSKTQLGLWKLCGIEVL